MKMASAAQTEDICAVCLESLKNPRILDCNHTFCLVCLDKLENNKTITCPVCRADTKIRGGLEVCHLPKKNVRSMSPRMRPRPATVVHSWQIDSRPNDLVVDDGTGLIFVSTYDSKKTIQIYTLNGKYHGHFWAEGLDGCYLTIDSKRSLLVAAKGNYITKFDMEGAQTAHYTCQGVAEILGIAYHKSNDIYIVTSRSGQLYFIEPIHDKVTKNIPSGDKVYSMSVACDKYGYVKSFVTCAPSRNEIGLYNPHSNFMKFWSSRGERLGQFNHPTGVCITRKGHAIVFDDKKNSRILGLDLREAEKGWYLWQVVGSVEGLGLLKVRALDATEDGMVVAIMYDEHQEAQPTPPWSIGTPYEKHFSGHTIPVYTDFKIVVINGEAFA